MLLLHNITFQLLNTQQSIRVLFNSIQNKRLNDFKRILLITVPIYYLQSKYTFEKPSMLLSGPVYILLTGFDYY